MIKGISRLICIFLLVLLGDVKIGLAQKAVISLDDVKIYSLPMVDEHPVAVLTQGEIVRIIGQRGAWVKIELENGSKGWMQLQVPRKPKPGQARAMKAAANISANSGNGNSAAGANVPGALPPDIRRKPKSKLVPSDQAYRRFGYSFGMGWLEFDFTYNWKFVYYMTPRLALEGAFKHTLGDAADSYFILSNLSYLLKNDASHFQPYVTGGLGVINTVPERSIGTDGVSNMAINYGIGARKYFKPNLSFLFNLTQYTVFVGKGIRNFREFTFGLLVGKFWD